MPHKQKSRPGGGGDSVVEPAGKQFTPEDNKAVQQSQALHYSEARTAIAHVVPDDEWPGMFRIAWPDGSQSDIVNLSRAKDAAVVIAGRSMPGHKPSLFRWSREPLRRPLVRSKLSGHAEVAAALQPEIWTASDAIVAEMDNADWLDWPAEVPA